MRDKLYNENIDKQELKKEGMMNLEQIKID